MAMKLKMDRGEWFRVDGEHIEGLAPQRAWRCMVQVSSLSQVQIILVDEDGDEVPVFTGTQFRWRERVVGAHALIVRTTGPAGVRVSINGMQIDEPRNDDPPPDQQVEAGNLLARIRAEARRSLGVQREAFAEYERDFPGGYELAEDDPGLFEEQMQEEVAAAAAAAQKEAELQAAQAASGTEEAKE